MSSVIDLYEQLNAAPDERARSRLIADSICSSGWCRSCSARSWPSLPRSSSC